METCTRCTQTIKGGASVKLYVSDMWAHVTEMTLKMSGDTGLIDDFPIERFWHNTRFERFTDGTSGSRSHIIGWDPFRPLGASVERLFRPRNVAIVGDG